MNSILFHPEFNALGDLYHTFKSIFWRLNQILRTTLGMNDLFDV